MLTPEQVAMIVVSDSIEALQEIGSNTGFEAQILEMQRLTAIRAISLDRKLRNL